MKKYSGYLPRPLQEWLHANLKRFNVIVMHRRGGKTTFSLAEMVDRSLRNLKRNPQYAYIAPTYGQAKRVAWTMLKDMVRHIPGVTINEAELRVDIPRPHLGDFIRIMLLGAENPASLKGIYLDGVILDEFAECDPIVWTEVVRPALSDRIGWAIFIGTPKGMNHFWQVYKEAALHDNWFRTIQPVSKTRLIPDSELKQALATQGVDKYNQEYECDWGAALVGAYYGKQMGDLEKAKRIVPVPHAPGSSVVTAWDLGIGDSTAIWFAQRIGRELRLIDYVEASGMGMPFYAKEIKRRNYLYEDHYVPHDAKQRELGTGKTRVETLYALGIRVTVLPRQSLDDGIQASRLLLASSWFDSVRCERGVDCLKNYQRKWDSKMNIFLQKPLRNWATHGADAFRSLAMGFRMEDRPDRSTLPRQAESNYDIMGV